MIYRIGTKFQSRVYSKIHLKVTNKTMKGARFINMASLMVFTAKVERNSQTKPWHTFIRNATHTKKWAETVRLTGLNYRTSPGTLTAKLDGFRRCSEFSRYAATAPLLVQRSTYCRWLSGGCEVPLPYSYLLMLNFPLLKCEHAQNCLLR